VAIEIVATGLVWNVGAPGVKVKGEALFIVVWRILLASLALASRLLLSFAAAALLFLFLLGRDNCHIAADERRESGCRQRAKRKASTRSGKQ
jgi:hypothetical protein